MSEVTNYENTYQEDDVAFKDLSLWDKIKAIFHIVRSVACFTTVFMTIGYIFSSIGMNGDKVGFMIVGGMMLFIGLLSLLLACPLKMVLLVGTLVVKGFTIGLCFVGVGCIIGAVIGLIIGLAIVIIIPAAVTIPHYLNNMR